MVALPHIIWVDSNVDGEENLSYIQELKSLGYYRIKGFKNINESIEHIKTIEFEDTIIIVSGSLYISFIEAFKSNLNDIFVIPKIIIFGANKEKLFQNNRNNRNIINKTFYNVGGFHNSFNEIKNYIENCKKGEKKVKLKRDHEAELIFDYIDCQEKLALPTLYEALIHVTPNDKIPEFTKKIYQKYSKYLEDPKCLKGNKDIVNLLDSIVNMPEIPIELLSKYYSRIFSAESNFYTDINNDLILKNRDNYLPFIKVLYEGANLDSLSSSTPNDKLYRGGRLSEMEINLLQKYKEMKKPGLPAAIVFSKTFLSFSKDKEVAEFFLNKQEVEKKIITPNKLSKVLFILEKEENYDYSLKTYADLDKISFHPDEREVLFFPFSSFEIKDIKPKIVNNEQRYEIKLSYLGKYIKNFKLSKNQTLDENNKNITKALNNNNFYSPNIEKSKTINISNMGNSISPKAANNYISKMPDIANKKDKFKEEIINCGLIEPEVIKKNNTPQQLLNTYIDYKRKIDNIKINKINNKKALNNSYIPNYPINYFLRRFDSSEINDNDNAPNYIDAILNISKNDINQNIRIINSFEQYKSKGNNLIRNKNDIIDNLEININGKNVKPNYFIRTNSPGKYKIRYTFKNKLTRTDYLFAECQNLELLDLLNFNTRKVTNMSCMFYRCSSLKVLRLSTLQTTNVTDMSYMFNECISLINLDLSFFNTKNVVNMSRMFCNCLSLKNINLKNLITKNVTDMYCMFYNCKSLTHLDLTSFDTRNVINMTSMFCGCESLIYLNISNFNTEKVIYMSSLFKKNKSLLQLNAKNFQIDNVENTGNIFSGCKSLQRLNIICDHNIVKKVNFNE